MTWPLATQLTTAIPGDGFDGWQNYWNQWWIKVALVDRIQSPLYTDLLYAPTGVGLYFHTLNPFNGLTTLPIQLSAGLIPAYNAVVFLSWPLAGYGVYLLVTWLLRTTKKQRSISVQFAAFLAGVIFTFSPFHMAHLLGHMQVMSLQWIPFYLLYLLRATSQSRTGQSWLRSALLAGLFLTLTGLCDWYFVLYLFFFTGLVLLWQWGLTMTEKQKTQGAPRTTRFIGIGLAAVVAGAVMVALLSPLLLPMVREATQFSFMVRPGSDLYILSASLLDFLIPNRLHTLLRPASFGWPGNQIAPVSERTIAVGYLPLILASLGLWYRAQRGTLRNLWLISALFFFLLALGPQWHIGNITEADIPKPGSAPVAWTPFALLNEIIPFMRISRSVSRYALMVQLSMAVLAGLGLHQLLQQTGRRDTYWRQWGLSMLLLLIVLGEFWVAPFPMSPPDTPAFYSTLRTLDQSSDTMGTVLNVPMNYDRPGYLLYQTVHQQPLAVAYISRDDPRTLTERVPVLQHLRHLGPDILDVDPVMVGATVLHDLGIGIVVQDRYKMPGGLEREYTEQLINAIFAEEQPLHADDRLTVHRVVPPADPMAYMELGALHWGPLTMSKATGQRQRLLSVEGAQLHFRHTPRTADLEIRYYTAPGRELTVVDSAGTVMQNLPPAPEGTTVTINLHAIVGEMEIEGDEAWSLVLQPEAEDSVWIENLKLYP